MAYSAQTVSTLRQLNKRGSLRTFFRERIRRSLPDTQNPEVVILECDDSRIQRRLNIRPGKAFVQSHISGGVKAPQAQDGSLDGFLDYPAGHFDATHTLIVMTHTDCGGMKGLVNSILDGIPKGHSSTIDLVQELNSQEIEVSIRAADAKGMSRNEIANALTYIIALNSARNVVERKIHHEGELRYVSDIFDSKGISVVPAVLDLKSNSLQVFDPETHNFVRPSELTVEGERKKHTTFRSGSALSVNKGAVIPMDEIGMEIQVRLRQLREGHAQSQI